MEEAIVLIVDDELMIRRLMSLTLNTVNVKTAEAETGEAACKQLGASMLLALIDINLNGSSGIEVAKQLKEIRPSLKIVYMTGYNANGYSLRESDGILQKPFSPVQLKGKVLSILHNSGWKPS